MVSQDLFVEASKRHRSSLGFPPRICKKPPLHLKGHASEGESSGNLIVIGKHALLFDDDDAAFFINSSGSLLPWNGDEKLMLDRYDVRHLLQDLSGLRRRHVRPSSPDATQGDLNYERYRDLEGIDRQETETEENVKRQKTSAGAYQSVGFSYDATCVSQNSPTKLDIAVYRPPFPVPKELEAYLPPSQKVHQIIVGTAKFVSEHGGQSEIILRVKQANNPTFGFLMPENHLHVYFRFLVEHPALLGGVPKSPQKSMISIEKSSEGLSMLGEFYGDDDEDDDNGKVSHMIQSSDDSKMSSLVGQHGGSSPDDSLNEDVRQGKNDSSSNKEGAVLSEDHAISNETGLLGLSGNASPVSCHSGSLQSELLEEVISSTYEMFTSEPPPPGTEVLNKATSNNLQCDDNVAVGSSDIPIVHEDPPFQINKVAKSISCNGKEFEAIVQERNNVDGRFQFLLPSNEHHAHHFNTLQQEETQTDKKHLMEEDMKSIAARSSEKSNAFKSTPVGSSLPEVPASTKTKSTLRQVDPEVGKILETKISGSADTKVGHGISSDTAAALVRAATRGPLQFSLIKKVVKDVEGRNKQPSKECDRQPCGMSLDAAAEAVMAATHGPWKERKNALTRRVEHNKLVDLGTFMNKPKESIEALKCGVDDKMLGIYPQKKNPHSIHHESRLHQEDTLVKVVAKAAAAAAVAAAAYEADSADAQLTPEEKRKAERLKKAKLFAAMIQSGANVVTKVECGSDSNAVSTSLNVDQSDQAAGSYGLQRTVTHGNSRKSSEASQAGCEQNCSSDIQQGEVSMAIPVELIAVGSSQEKSDKEADKQHRHRRRHRHHHHHEDSGHRRKKSHAEDGKKENSHSEQEVDGVSFCDTGHVKNKDRKDHDCSSKEEKEVEGPEPPLHDVLSHRNGRSLCKRTRKIEDTEAEKLESGSYAYKKGHDSSLSFALSKGRDNARIGRESFSHTENSRNRVEELYNDNKESVKGEQSNRVKYRHNDITLPETEGEDTHTQKKRATHWNRASRKNEDRGDCSPKDNRSKCKGLSSEVISSKQESSAKEEPFAAAVVTTDISDDLRAKVRAMLLQIH